LSLSVIAASAGSSPEHHLNSRSRKPHFAGKTHTASLKTGDKANIIGLLIYNEGLKLSDIE
jgi:hypothetical protein